MHAYSLLCGPISPVVNLKMSSTARFFLWKCNIWVLRTRKLAFCVIDLITMLISKITQSRITSLLSYPEPSLLCLYPHFHLLGSQKIIISIAFCVIDLLSMLIK